ncbi:unnamed protein product, partial [Ectocarpus sp. 8 AP-2014]
MPEKQMTGCPINKKRGTQQIADAPPALDDVCVCRPPSVHLLTTPNPPQRINKNENNGNIEPDPAAAAAAQDDHSVPIPALSDRHTRRQSCPAQNFLPLTATANHASRQSSHPGTEKNKEHPRGPPLWRSKYTPTPRQASAAI